MKGVEAQRVTASTGAYCDPMSEEYGTLWPLVTKEKDINDCQKVCLIDIKKFFF